MNFADREPAELLFVDQLGTRIAYNGQGIGDITRVYNPNQD
jgi:hypothetical protein